MIIEIHDKDLEARLTRQMERTGVGTAVRALQHLLETQEEQDRWLLENREAINARIWHAIGQLEQGKGIPEDEVDEQLERLKRLP